MNSIVLSGRLSAKPELRYTTSSNRAFCPFTIACNGANDEVEFLDCVAWGKQAENLCNFQDKGDMVGVTGRLTTNMYTNKDGIKVKKYVISANTIEFLATKSSKIKETKVVDEPNPFEEFGEQVTIDDNFLD